MSTLKSATSIGASGKTPPPTQAGKASDWGSLRFVSRPDLSVTQRSGMLGQEWILKDPISLEYFLMQADEMRVWRALQTPRTVEQLYHYLHERPGPPLTLSELAAFLQRLCADNLAITLDGRNGARLNLRATALQKRQRLSALAGILAIKLPGFSADSVLKPLDWIGWLLFNPLTLIGFMTAWILTLVWVVLSLSSIAEHVPAVGWFTTPQNLLALFLGYLCVKACHELGHGLACRYYGAQVREMGVLLLFFSPCLYCDASDAWTIPQRYRRMMISLAGVYVEMIFSLLFLWAWWFNSSADVSAWLFGMMLTTSANTLFVNGNPLLKFDGYFALADWWDIPNLSNVSQRHLSQFTRSIFFRDPESVEFTWETRLVLYATLSMIYRWSILFTILSAGYWILRANGLEMLGIVTSLGLSLLVLGGAMFKSLMGTLRVVARPHKRWVAWLATILILGLCGAWFVNFPLERRIRGTAVLELAKPQRVYAARSGFLQPKRLLGSATTAGEIIASIDDPNWQQRYVELNQDIQLLKKQIEVRRLNRVVSYESSGEIEFLEKRLERLNSELVDLKREETTRDVVATQAGFLFPPLAPRTGKLRPGMPPEYRFIASKLRPDSHRGYVEKGELLALVGKPHQLVATILVNPFEQQAVRPGQTAKLLLNHTGQVIRGKVHVSELPELPVAHRGTLANLEAESITFRVVLELPEIRSPHLRPGMTVPCLVEVERTTPLGWLQLWIRRWIVRTF